MGFIVLQGSLTFENYSQTEIKLTFDNGYSIVSYFFDKRSVEISIPDDYGNSGQLLIVPGVGPKYPNVFQFGYSSVVSPATSSVEEFRNIINGWLYTGGPQISVNGSTNVGPLNTINLIEGTNITITAVDNYTTNAVDVTIDASGGSGVTSVTATGLLTSSGGTTPDISSQVAKGKLVGRNSVTAGIMEEITVGSGLTLSGTTLSASVSDSITHATASGTDTYSATITGVTSYADGDCYLIRFTNGNTTGATININSLGAVTLYRNNDGALIGGDIVDGAEMLLIYNSTLGGFQCIGVAPNTLLAYVTNAETITITKGQPVYVSGGVGDRIKVKLAYNTSDATSAQTIGIVLSTSIAANQKGLVIVQGQLDGLTLFPTATWADGDYIYLGATAGTITNVKPHAPNHLVYLGYVTTASNGAAGRWYVKVQNGYEMDELHNVSAQTPSNNDGLFYNTTTSLWESKSIPTALGYTPVTNARTISTTSPLTGGGDLSANRTLSIADAAADGTTKGAAAFTASDFNSASGVISIDYANGQAASGSNKGFLTSADWSTFNSKIGGSGTTSFVPRFSAGSTLASGIIQDNGTNAGVNIAPSTLYKFHVSSPSTLSPQTAIRGTSASVGVDGYGSIDNGTVIGVQGLSTDNGNPFASLVCIGGKFTGLGGGNFNYSVQLQDGTEGLNKVLLSTTADGKANWSAVKTINSNSIIGSGNISVGTVTAVTGTAPIVSSGGTTPAISIPAATSGTDGYLTSADWSAFNNKQNGLTLTTTGTSGPATLVGSTLNVPQYGGVSKGFIIAMATAL